METFNNLLVALQFSKENPDTLAKLSELYSNGSVNRICHLFNGDYHGVYIRYNKDGSIHYRKFCVNGIRNNGSGLSEIQLQNIFGECYENF